MNELVGPNWADVLRRADVQRRRQRRRAALAGAAALLVVGVGSAFAARAVFHGARPRPVLRSEIPT